MNKIKKVLLLTAILALSICFIAGCGKKKNTNTIDKNTIYKEEEINLNLPKGFNVNTVVTRSGKILISGYTYDETTYESKAMWGVSSFDGSNIQFVECEPNSWIDRFIVGDDGSIYIFYSTSFEDNSDPENYVYESRYYVCKYSSDCKLVKKIDLGEEYEMDWVNEVMILGDSVLISSNGYYYYFDTNLDFKAKKEVSQTDYYNIIKLRDGSYAATTWGDNGQKLVRFDINTFECGDEIEIPVSLYNYSVIDSESFGYDILLRDSSQVYGFNIGDSALTPLFNFINSDVTTSYFQSLTAIDDKTFIGSYYDWYSDNYTFKICKYTKVNPEDVKEKELISIGCLYMDSDLRKRVVDFNKSSDEYRITMIDYSSYATEEDWNAGTTKLNSDIASGQAPDIIVMSDYSKLENYMSKGLFLDLSKYLDNDTDVNKNDLFPNLLEVTSYNGKMYAVVPSFYVRTLAAKSKFLNGKTTWTLQEMIDFEKTLQSDQKLFQSNTRYNFTYNYFSANANSFVDYTNGKCNFDSEEFITFLEYLKTLPEESDEYSLYDGDIYYEKDYYNSEDDYRADRVIVSEAYINSLREYKTLLHGTFGEDITLIGFPTSSGNGSVMTFSSLYSINAKTANPDACWEFVKYYLTDEYQDTISYAIPASMTRFDELGKEVQERPFYMDGDEKVYYDDEYYMNGEWVPMDPLTQAEVDELKEYIKTVKTIYGNLGELETIIDEETAAFFEGQKTAEDVVKIIQSRATIYINERQ